MTARQFSGQNNRATHCCLQASCPDGIAIFALGSQSHRFTNRSQLAP
jgi:hypothetical protein